MPFPFINATIAMVVSRLFLLSPERGPLACVIPDGSLLHSDGKALLPVHWDITPSYEAMYPDGAPNALYAG